MHTMLSVLATPDVTSIRTAEFRGAEHTVIPVVALVEGVLWAANSPRPELALAEEFGRFPQGWDGSPVVFDHPKDADGVPIPANSPNVLEDNAFGHMFNTTLDGSKLKSEIWINQGLVENLSDEGQATVAKLIAGDNVIEVSTGMFLMSEARLGSHNGQKFEAVWRHVVPDHLAVLPEGVAGACSVADGCGAPRDNEGKTEMVPVMRAAQLNTNCSCDTVVSNTSDEEGLFQRLLQRIGALAGVDTKPESTIQENAMHTKEELVNGLIANTASQFTEEDRGWLETLEDAQLAKLSPVDNVVVEDPLVVEDPIVVEDPATVDNVTELRPVGGEPEVVVPISTEDYIASAPEEIQAVLNESLAMHKARKAVLVTALVANSRCNFTQAQLDSKDIPELENLAALAVDISYELGGANLNANAGNDADTVPEPAKLFDLSANAQS